MKKIISALIFTISTQSMAGVEFFCSLKYLKPVVAVAKSHSTYDKNLHCAVSCMLTLRCNSKEVLLVGYLKEFKDLLGPGNAERADIEADKYGISLVKHKRAMEDKECQTQCDLRY